MEHIRTKNLYLMYRPHWLNAERCEELWPQLLALPYVQNNKVVVRGISYDVARQQAAFSDPHIYYRFAGTAFAGQPWPDFLQELREELNEYLQHWFSCELNYVFVNHYRDGHDKIGWHHDDERDMQEVDEEIIIVSLSFGVTRDFYLQSLESGKKVNLSLGEGDLLVFRQRTNKYWKHSVPPRRRIREPRINLTFRVMRTQVPRIFADEWPELRRDFVLEQLWLPTHLPTCVWDWDFLPQQKFSSLREAHKTLSREPNMLLFLWAQKILQNMTVRVALLATYPHPLQGQDANLLMILRDHFWRWRGFLASDGLAIIDKPIVN